MATNREMIVKFLRPEQVPKRPERVRNVDGIKYFNNKQIKLLRRTVRDQAEISLLRNQLTGVREWVVIDLLTSTGVRVSEAANLRCGDLKVGHTESKIFIREGKGKASGHIVINEALKKNLKQFLNWKREHGESTDADAHLFSGQRGPWTSQAIQQIVKKYLKALDLYERGKSVHALRHGNDNRKLTICDHRILTTPARCLCIAFEMTRVNHLTPVLSGKA